MPQFQYTARDQFGAASSGTMVADDATQAAQILRTDGKYPTSVKPVGTAEEGNRHSASGRSMSRKDLIHVSTQLAIMIETGVTLSESLECILAQTVKPNVKAILKDVTQSVHSGGDFSTALRRHPRAFPRLFIALIAASEKSGMMSKMLIRANNYLRDEYETIRRVRGALIYPAIMFGFALLTTTFLLAFVLPRFTAIYIAKKAALPTPTLVLMGLSNFLIHDWPLILIALAILGTGGFLAARTRAGLLAMHYGQLYVPVFGPIFCKLHLARGLRMVGTMAGSGVSLVDAVKTARDLCSNSLFRNLWDEVSQQIQAGKQLSEPLFRNSLVPRPIAQMLHSAEKGGKLASVMEQVATYSEQELKETIADMTKLIEPAMIVVMGAIIGGVVMALMLPIFTISRVAAQ